LYPAGRPRSVPVVGKRRNGHNVDAIFDERMEFVVGRGTVDRTRSRVALVDATRLFGEGGSDILGIPLQAR